jgi:hypothetical protein
VDTVSQFVIWNESRIATDQEIESRAASREEPTNVNTMRDGIRALMKQLRNPQEEIGKEEEWIHQRYCA